MKKTTGDKNWSQRKDGQWLPGTLMCQFMHDVCYAPRMLTTQSQVVFGFPTFAELKSKKSQGKFVALKKKYFGLL